MRFFAYTPLLATVLASPSNHQSRLPTSVKKVSASNSTVNQDRANAVKDMFQIGWDGYYQYAFPKDQLRPVNNSGYNPR
jgi:mannosyl-oligosaccharide alpha-1,2-mannosidase